MIAFGGLAGLEECIEEDNELKVFWNSFLSIISITGVLNPTSALYHSSLIHLVLAYCLSDKHT